MNLVKNYLWWVLGLTIAIIVALFGSVTMALAATGASEASDGMVTRHEFAVKHDNTICYGNVSVRTGDVDRALRAGLVNEDEGVSVEEKFSLARQNSSWGECVINDAPTNHTRLTSVSPVLYLTQCDVNSSIGGMRVTYAVIDGVQEPNVVYLHYDVEDDPCAGGMLFITENNNDWQEACFVQPLSLVVDPTGRSSFDMGHAPVQYRCDPVLGR